MPREPIPTWFFALIVVRRGDRFLLVHEAKHGQPWYMPAGRVERGEALGEAARREVLEEGGIRVRLTGVIRVEHTVISLGARVRVIFTAEPSDDTPPKSVPDDESLGAVWVSLDEVSQYPLRGPEVVDFFRHVLEGKPVYPLSLLEYEGAPLPDVIP